MNKTTRLKSTQVPKRYKYELTDEAERAAQKYALPVDLRIGDEVFLVVGNSIVTNTPEKEFISFSEDGRTLFTHFDQPIDKDTRLWIVSGQSPETVVKSSNIITDEGGLAKQKDLEKEIADRIAAIGATNVRIDGVVSDLDEERTARENADTNLQEQIDAIPTELPIASTTTLGGIKVGNNLTITEDGTLSATGGGGGGDSVYDTNGVYIVNTTANGVSIGRSATKASNGVVIGSFASGTTSAPSVAVGQSANASSQYATAIGYNARATNSNATAVGYDTSASGQNDIAVGYGANTSGGVATAIGYGASASSNSIAIGTSVTSASMSTAVGPYAKTTAGNANAFGSNSQATYQYSTAVGDNAKAISANTTAVGASANATNSLATAVGQSSTASGFRSVSLGWGSTASNQDEFSIGSSSIKRKITNVANGTNNNDAVNVSQLDALSARVDGLSMAKAPNVVIIGEPTINQGQTSDFSASDYLQFPFILDLTGKTFQIDFCFTTGNNVTTQQNIIDSKFGIALAIQNGKGVMAVSSDGETWNIGTSTGTFTIAPNTTYFARLSWDGTTYRTALSTNGTSYTNDMSIASSVAPFPTTHYIGGANDTIVGHTVHPFTGVIDLNKSDMYVNGELYWEGMDSLGLLTRADVSLSNIDAAGEERIRELAGSVDAFVIREWS